MRATLIECNMMAVGPESIGSVAIARYAQGNHDVVAIEKPQAFCDVARAACGDQDGALFLRKGAGDMLRADAFPVSGPSLTSVAHGGTFAGAAATTERRRSSERDALPIGMRDVGLALPGEGYQPDLILVST